jgi:hypothetical protein
MKTEKEQFTAIKSTNMAAEGTLVMEVTSTPLNAGSRNYAW